ncbi:hypothetical protein TNCV_1089261 [Trichonephila clavipes]|uniref:Uncharacterized protein n=1 Tax=Trichonephila clavipes TaxID=2585209 RepID=A0A8X6VR10_TRICX|nr:hypothetical protein TNCV_1089261 [Trichonephila clavipes]
MAGYEELTEFINLPSTFTESRSLFLVRRPIGGYQSPQVTCESMYKNPVGMCFRKRLSSEVVRQHADSNLPITRGHWTTPLRVKEDIEDVSSELGNGVKGCTSRMKRPELYCSRQVRI